MKMMIVHNIIYVIVICLSFIISKTNASYTVRLIDMECYLELGPITTTFTTDNAEDVKEALHTFYDSVAWPRIQLAINTAYPETEAYSYASAFLGGQIFSYSQDYYGNVLDIVTKSNGNIVIKYRYGMDLEMEQPVLTTSRYSWDDLKNIIKGVMKLQLNSNSFIHHITNQIDNTDYLNDVSYAALLDSMPAGVTGGTNNAGNGKSGGGGGNTINIPAPPTPNPTPQPTPSPTDPYICNICSSSTRYASNDVTGAHYHFWGDYRSCEDIARMGSEGQIDRGTCDNLKDKETDKNCCKSGTLPTTTYNNNNNNNSANSLGPPCTHTSDCSGSKTCDFRTKTCEDTYAKALRSRSKYRARGNRGGYRHQNGN